VLLKHSLPSHRPWRSRQRPSSIFVGVLHRPSNPRLCEPGPLPLTWPAHDNGCSDMSERSFKNDLGLPPACPKPWPPKSAASVNRRPGALQAQGPEVRSPGCGRRASSERSALGLRLSPNEDRFWWKPGKERGRHQIELGNKDFANPCLTTYGPKCAQPDRPRTDRYQPWPCLPVCWSLSNGHGEVPDRPCALIRAYRRRRPLQVLFCRAWEGSASKPRGRPGDAQLIGPPPGAAQRRIQATNRACRFAGDSSAPACPPA